MKCADNALIKWEELDLDYVGENKYASFFHKWEIIRIAQGGGTIGSSGGAIIEYAWESQQR